MENVYLVLGYLGLVSAVLTLVEMVSKLAKIWRYLCENDDGNFYDETWE